MISSEIMTRIYRGSDRDNTKCCRTGTALTAVHGTSNPLCMYVVSKKERKHIRSLPPHDWPVHDPSLDARLEWGGFSRSKLPSIQLGCEKRPRVPWSLVQQTTSKARGYVKGTKAKRGSPIPADPLPCIWCAPLISASIYSAHQVILPFRFLTPSWTPIAVLR